MKKLFLILFLGSCIDPTVRQEKLQEKYPTYKISPATSLLADQGYEFLMEDTLQKQIYAVSFYTFGNKKIYSIRNIK